MSGTKYALRSVWAPVLRELRAFSSTRLYVFDYPQQYSVGAMVEALCAEKAIEDYRMIPDSGRVVRHHVTMRAVCREVRQQRCDVLVVPADFMPMHQYIIRAGRYQGALVLALQGEPPTQLLTAYRDVWRGAAAANGAHGGIRRSLARRVGGTLSRLTRPSSAGTVIRGVRRLLRAEATRRSQYFLEWKLLPMLLTGQTFQTYSYEQSGAILFASRRVDAAVVYSDVVRDALHFFFPDMRVVVARHPQSENCRCGDAASEPALLVALGGPWANYVTATNSLDDIERRWMEAIVRANAFGKFSRIAIRPHPRERGPHADRLAERLRRHGLNAAAMDPTAQTIPDVVCDYAGILGTESGALTEAAVSCRRAFVLAVEAIQGRRHKPLAEDYSDVVVAVPESSALRAEHFARRADAMSSRPSAAEVIRQLVEERACVTR